ncbi:hypothetical protein, partial [Staphylococcus epidermidis]
KKKKFNFSPKKNWVKKNKKKKRGVNMKKIKKRVIKILVSCLIGKKIRNIISKNSIDSNKNKHK